MRLSAAPHRRISLPALLALGAVLAVAPAWTPADSRLESPASRVVEIELAREEGSFQSHRLAPPLELAGLDLGSGNAAYLLPGVDGVRLVVYTAGGYLVPWIGLRGSRVYGLLEPRVVLSRFEVSEDLTAVTLEYGYVLPGGKARPDHLWGFVGICRVASGIPASDCQQVEAWQAEVPEAEREDAYAARRSVEDADRPVRSASTCLRVHDHDGDGFRDLILERRWRQPSGTMGEAIVLPKRDLLWLRFDPEPQRFRAGRPVADTEGSEELSCTGPDPGSESQTGSESE